MHITIIDKTTNEVIFTDAREALGFFSRLSGLMFKKTILPQEALIFYYTPSIHTFFMRFAIDIVFINNDKQIIKIYRNLKPNKTIYCRNSYCAIECLGGSSSVKRIEIGHYLEFIKEYGVK